VARFSLPGPYNGVIHRSRTEGRWAIFFHHLGIDAPYEEQGFDTDGEWYLPDFHVQAANGPIWVEIKSATGYGPEEERKFRRFAAQRPQPSRAAFITGLPSLHNRPIVFGGDDNQKDPAKGGWEDDTMEWRPCRSGKHFDLTFPGVFHGLFVDDGCADGPGCMAAEQRLAEASVIALSHRFDSVDAAKGTAA
jgi:hypothetical protein